jgi:hypothetical protein
MENPEGPNLLKAEMLQCNAKDKMTGFEEVRVNKARVVATRFRSVALPSCNTTRPAVTYSELPQITSPREIQRTG